MVRVKFSDQLHLLRLVCAHVAFVVDIPGKHGGMVAETLHRGARDVQGAKEILCGIVVDPHWIVVLHAQNQHLVVLLHQVEHILRRRESLQLGLLQIPPETVVGQKHVVWRVLDEEFHVAFVEFAVPLNRFPLLIPLRDAQVFHVRVDADGEERLAFHDEASLLVQRHTRLLARLHHIHLQFGLQVCGQKRHLRDIASRRKVRLKAVAMLLNRNLRLEDALSLAVLNHNLRLALNALGDILREGIELELLMPLLNAEAHHRVNHLRHPNRIVHLEEGFAEDRLPFAQSDVQIQRHALELRGSRHLLLNVGPVPRSNVSIENRGVRLAEISLLVQEGDEHGRAAHARHDVLCLHPDAIAILLQRLDAFQRNRIPRLSAPHHQSRLTVPPRMLLNRIPPRQKLLAEGIDREIVRCRRLSEDRQYHGKNAQQPHP